MPAGPGRSEIACRRVKLPCKSYSSAEPATARPLPPTPASEMNGNVLFANAVTDSLAPAANPTFPRFIPLRRQIFLWNR